jgi:hypothetical protein
LLKVNNKNKLNHQIRTSVPFYLIVTGSNRISSLKCRNFEFTNTNSENNNQVRDIIKSNQAAHKE